MNKEIAFRRDSSHKVYNYKKWLQIINEFTGKNVIDQKESMKIEKKDLDEWWWNKHYKDFSRYSSWQYLYAALNCFVEYSRWNVIVGLENLESWDLIKEIDSVVDVGAGIGLSTMLLADSLPWADVHYNNIPSIQVDFFKKHKHQRIKLSSERDLVKHGPFDLILASEYFEHFEEPIKQLEFLQNEVGFKIMIVSNSFTAKSYGHFKSYIIEGREYEPRQMSAIFNSVLEGPDYDRPKVAKSWNLHPQIFIRRNNDSNRNKL